MQVIPIRSTLLHTVHKPFICANILNMESKLAQISSLTQKDKGPAFIALISEIFSRSGPDVAKDLHTLVDTVVNQDSVGLVVGRQVLSELVKSLGEGIIQDADVRKRVVEDTLQTVQPRIVSYEEQVCLILHITNDQLLIKYVLYLSR